MFALRSVSKAVFFLLIQFHKYPLEKQTHVRYNERYKLMFENKTGARTKAGTGRME